jgi:hypothetical protein
MSVLTCQRKLSTRAVFIAFLGLGITDKKLTYLVFIYAYEHFQFINNTNIFPLTARREEKKII